MGLKFMGDIPFRQVYIHGLVRDAHGQKMSKSKGNTVDPLDLQRKYGTDAVRLTMAMLAAPGNDIPVSPERMDGYRAFVTKLWNACRFVLLRVGEDAVREEVSDRHLGLVDRWILSRTHQCIDEVQRSLEQYRFDRAADAVYHFVWHEFCDWYLEMVKPDLAEDAPPERRRTARAVLLETVDVVLRLLHPFVPYVTEELWQRFKAASDQVPVTAGIGPLVRVDVSAASCADPDYRLSVADLLSWEARNGRLIEMFKVWEGGLVSHGAAIGILIALYLFSKKKKNYPMLWTLDRVVIVVALPGTFIRLGNLFNSEIIGKPTDVSWAFIYTAVDDIPRHPAQLYESIAYFIIFLILLFVYYKGIEKNKGGLLFGIFLVLVFTFRFFVEFVKENQSGFEEAMFLNMGQILSLPFVIAGIIFIAKSFKPKTKR